MNTDNRDYHNERRDCKFTNKSVLTILELVCEFISRSCFPSSRCGGGEVEGEEREEGKCAWGVRSGVVGRVSHTCLIYFTSSIVLMVYIYLSFPKAGIILYVSNSPAALMVNILPLTCLTSGLLV